MEEVKNMKAINIKWDTDGEEVQPVFELPTEVEIPRKVIEEAISEYLSDWAGFCHKGFEIVE